MTLKKTKCVFMEVRIRRGQIASSCKVKAGRLLRIGGKAVPRMWKAGHGTWGVREVLVDV